MGVAGRGGETGGYGYDQTRIIKDDVKCENIDVIGMLTVIDMIKG